MVIINFRPLGLVSAFALMAVSAMGADKESRVRVELYVMSLCPFGVQAENGLLPVAKAYEKQIDLRLGFIASAAPGAEGASPKFSSLHGEPEVVEDIRQLCVKELAPKKYLDFILERNKNISSPDWQAAAKAVGIDAPAIERCAGGAQGQVLLVNNISAARDRNANGSPTIYIDSVAYSGGRTPKAFEWTICSAIKARGVKPPLSCETALASPQPSAAVASDGGDCADGSGAAAKTATNFDIWIVRESACTACELTLLNNLKKLHPGAAFKILEADSNAGKAMIAKHRPQALPLYVLDRKVEAEDNFSSLLNSQYARSADQYIIKPGPESYTPTVQLSRARQPRHLDILMDPFSPFAARAQTELITFLTRSKVKDLTFSMHFLVQEGVSTEGMLVKAATGNTPRSASLSELREMKPGPLTTGRGEVGLKESLRQACLFQNAPMTVYFSYVSCRDQALMDPEVPQCLRPDDRLKACMAGAEGERLLRYDARLARDLGVNTSFALLWENRYGPFGWHDVDWKELIESRP